MFFGHLEKLNASSGIEAGLNLLSLDPASFFVNKQSDRTSRRRHTLNGPYPLSDDCHLVTIVHRHQVVHSSIVMNQARRGRNNEDIIAQPGSSGRADQEDVRKKRAVQPKNDGEGRNTVFVGNISYRMTQRDLKDFFSKFGRVNRVQLLKDHVKKHSRGIAFVTFAKQKPAQEAQKASPEERTLDGREMRVFPARDKRMKIFKKELKECESAFLDKNDQSFVEEATSILDDDSLLLIFSYLPLDNLLDVELVCQRWKRLVGRCWASKRVLKFTNSFIAFDGKVMTDDIFKGIIRHCGENLVELDVSCVARFLTYKSIELIAELCPNLERLNLSGGEVTDVGIKQISSKCKALKEIHLQRCINIGEKGFWWLLHLSQKLTALNITDNLRITGKCFYRVGPDIRTLSLKNCVKIGEFGFEKIGEHCKDLSQLNLNGCASLTDEGLHKICRGCSKLQKLSLSGTFSLLTFAGVAHIGLLKHLNDLDLSNNMNVNDQALFRIGSSCLELRSLDLSACSGDITDAGITSFENCKQLKFINFSYLESMSDDSLVRLAQNGVLEEVKIRGCMSVSSSGCRQLLIFCPHLRVLDMSGCEMIGDPVMDYSLEAVQIRENGLVLLVTIGGTSVNMQKIRAEHPLLQIETLNLCNQRYLAYIPEGLLPSEGESSAEDDGWRDNDLDDFLDGEDLAMEFDREWMS